MSTSNEISYKNELLRKGIHLLSLSLPVTYAFISRELALAIFVPMALISIIFDILSRKENKFQKLFQKVFGQILRSHEHPGNFTLNGASWVLISVSICVFVFPKIITLTGLSILILSDISAALIGRKYGKHPLFDKSIEGTIAFAVSAIVIVFIIGSIYHTPWTFFVVGIIASIIGAIVEAASHVLKVDDNMSIPFSIGFIMWGGGLLAAILHAPFLNIL